jgi:hypothetical protein
VFYLAQRPVILLAWDSAPPAAPELATYIEPPRAE